MSAQYTRAMRNAPLAAPLLYVQKRSVYAIDRELGRLRWKYDAAASLIRVLFAGDRVFALDIDCNVHCLRAEDGRALGVVSVGTRSAWGSALLAHDGGIYVATSDGVTALSIDGQFLWRFDSHDPGLDGVLPGLALPTQVVQPDKKD